MDRDFFNPFNYNLNLFVIPGTGPRTLICMHGSGANYEIAKTIKSLGITNSTLISFNFPDHDLLNNPGNSWPTFGTIEELLPALYVIKTCVIDHKIELLDLYGFSAGGAALTNAIGVLNRSEYDQQLKKIGIGPDEKAKMLEVIQKGIVLLDCPMKSVEEIIDLRGPSSELLVAADNYHKNNFRPITALRYLTGLSLKIILYFATPDEIIFNRDDVLYKERLKDANVFGTTLTLSSDSGGHCAPHLILWEHYAVL